MTESLKERFRRHDLQALEGVEFRYLLTLAFEEGRLGAILRDIGVQGRRLADPSRRMYSLSRSTELGSRATRTLLRGLGRLRSAAGQILPKRWLKSASWPYLLKRQGYHGSAGTSST